MRRRSTRLGGFARLRHMHRQLIVCVCAVLAAAGCTRSRLEEREYRLQGQVLAVAPNREGATIHHQEITGFMGEMTMPYHVRDPKQLEGVAPGDLINAKLVVVTNDAYLTDVRKVGQAPLPQPAAAPSAGAGAAPGVDLLKPGDPVPDTRFVDQDGRRRSFAAFKGAPVLVTFIYTNCPMPAFCPLMDQHFATIQKRLGENRSLDGRVRLVSITFDPARDTPAVLKRHAQQLGADPRTWTFLTGDEDAIAQFAMRFGVSVMRAPADPRDITHNLRTAIIDADGKLVKVYTGNEWTPDQALADLAAVAHAG